MSFITASSFVFNGKNSHDFGVVIGWLEESSNIDISINGLNREIKKTTNQNRIKSNIYGTENSDVITFKLGIFKVDEKEITRLQSMAINQWLMSSPLPQLLKFNDYDSYPLNYYAVCTQINDIVIGGRLIGKELKFETNSPFAFTQKSEKIFMISGSGNFCLNNYSDTYDGIYYPIITIITQADIIVIENITDKKSVTINTENISANSEGNKVIKLNSEKMTALDESGKLLPVNKLGWNEKYISYVSSTNEYIDNIYWVRFMKGLNEFLVTGDCTLRIEYEYPRRAGCL